MEGSRALTHRSGLTLGPLPPKQTRSMDKTLAPHISNLPKEETVSTEKTDKLVVGTKIKEITDESKTEPKSLKDRVKNSGMWEVVKHPLDSIGKAWDALPKSVKVALLVAVIAICIVAFIGVVVGSHGAALLPIAVVLFGLVFVASASAGGIMHVLGKEKSPPKIKDTDDKKDKDNVTGEGAEITVAGKPLSAAEITNLNDAKKEIGNKERELNTHEHNKSKLDEERDELEEQIRAEENKDVKNDAQIAELKTKLTNKNAEINSLCGKMEKAQKDFDSYTAKKDSIQGEINSLKQQKTGIEADLKTFYPELPENLKEQRAIPDANSRIDALNTAIGNLDKNAPDYSRKSALLERELNLAKIDAQIAELEGNTPPAEVKINEGLTEAKKSKPVQQQPLSAEAVNILEAAPKIKKSTGEQIILTEAVKFKTKDEIELDKEKAKLTNLLTNETIPKSENQKMIYEKQIQKITLKEDLNEKTLELGILTEDGKRIQEKHDEIETEFREKIRDKKTPQTEIDRSKANLYEVKLKRENNQNAIKSVEKNIKEITQKSEQFDNEIKELNSQELDELMKDLNLP